MGLLTSEPASKEGPRCSGNSGTYLNLNLCNLEKENAKGRKRNHVAMGLTADGAWSRVSLVTTSVFSISISGLSPQHEVYPSPVTEVESQSYIYIYTHRKSTVKEEGVVFPSLVWLDVRS